MPRFMVERTFPDGLAIPTNEQGRETTAKVASKNAEVGVTWVHSYVTPDRKKTYCIYTTNAANRRGGACISCRGGSELADAAAERGEDCRGRDASGLAEVIAVGAGHLVDQAVGTQQAEFATGPG